MHEIRIDFSLLAQDKCIF